MAALGLGHVLDLCLHDVDPQPSGGTRHDDDPQGRPNKFGTYRAGAAFAALSLDLARHDMQVIILAMALSFFVNGIAAGEYAYTPEVFPTRIRATGVGTASAIGRIGGISAPILVGAVYPIGGFAGVFGMTTVILLIGGLSVLILGIPTKNRSLEEIEAEEFAERV